MRARYISTNRREGFQWAFSKKVINLKEVNKKVIIVKHSEKLLKYLEDH
jgi:hypothetical protein